jgi:hypothetical protein
MLWRHPHQDGPGNEQLGSKDGRGKREDGWASVRTRSNILRFAQIAANLFVITTEWRIGVARCVHITSKSFPFMLLI